jgi:hypothetical protein
LGLCLLVRKKKEKIKKRRKENRRKTQRHREGLMLELEDLMPGCYLEVSLHLEGPAIGQLDQGFPWFPLVPEQMLSWYPNSTLHCMLPMQPSQW